MCFSLRLVVGAVGGVGIDALARIARVDAGQAATFGSPPLWRTSQTEL